MRYRTKLLIAAALLLALSLSAAALAYWGVVQSHSHLARSRIAHQELERDQEQQQSTGDLEGGHGDLEVVEDLLAEDREDGDHPEGNGRGPVGRAAALSGRE